MTGGTDRERFLLDILDKIEEPIMVVNRDYRILYVNKAAASRVGRTGEEVIGQKCYQVCDKAEAPPDFCPAARTLETGSHNCHVGEVMTSEDGPTFEEISTDSFRENGGSPEWVIERRKDVTKEKMLERRLIASERLAVLGELAASIAHEVNNPMGIILGFAQDLLTETDQSSPAYQTIKIIEEEAKRCSHVVRTLLDFARPMDPHHFLTDLRTLLQRSIELISSLAKKRHVVVEQRTTDSLPTLYVDPQQIHQVLVNLFLNALDAMPEGGALTISVRTGPSLSGTDHDELSDCVEIAVSDTGHGIREEDLPKIFLPFYSKKPNGMGIGLSVSKQIIEAHKGTISVKSSCKQGATFFIRLPLERRVEGRGVSV